MRVSTPAFFLLPALTAFSFGFTPARPADCDFTASRSAVVEAGGVERTRVVAQAGSLRIEGDPEISRVRIEGTACASSAELLEGVRLQADRDGDRILVRTELPETGGSWFGRDEEARLDLVVRVPGGMALDVEDGSGSTTIRNAGSVRLRDGSGSARMENIDGDLELEDGSGGLTVERVGGEVTLDDGSGSIELREVRGSVRLRDGSGSVRIERIEGSVVILSDGSGSIRGSEVLGDFVVEEDGSGSIRVSRIRGDFVVEEDRSGGIEFRDVDGAVRIPPGR